MGILAVNPEHHVNVSRVDFIGRHYSHAPDDDPTPIKPMGTCAAYPVLPVAGRDHGVVGAAWLAQIEIARVLPGDRMRAAFAGNLLPRRRPSLWWARRH